MLYISGIPALNIPCPTLDTSGDWHRSGLDWSKVPLWDSNLSFFGDWGIQSDIYVQEMDGYFNVADTLRACIDMVASGNFCRAQGMRDDYICNDNYNTIVFEKILSLKNKISSEKWAQIDSFMRKEYRLDWVRYSDQAAKEVKNGQTHIGTDEKTC